MWYFASLDDGQQQWVETLSQPHSHKGTADCNILSFYIMSQIRHIKFMLDKCKLWLQQVYQGYLSYIYIYIYKLYYLSVYVYMLISTCTCLHITVCIMFTYIYIYTLIYIDACTNSYFKLLDNCWSIIFQNEI